MVALPDDADNSEQARSIKVTERKPKSAMNEADLRSEVMLRPPGLVSKR